MLQVGWVRQAMQDVTTSLDLTFHPGALQNYFYVGPNFSLPEHRMLTRRTLTGWGYDCPDRN